jgi:hypothetical protein
MALTRSNHRELSLVPLEEIAVSARNGFACMFSTSDEYEAALIDERRAEGRYRKHQHLPMILFWGCAIGIAGVVLLASI